MPVFSDEGVFHTVADIVMAEPTQFEDLCPMLGMFHYTKVLLWCAGRYLLGSGVDEVLIENKSLWQEGSSVSTQRNPLCALTTKTVYCVWHVVCSRVGVILIPTPWIQ